MEHVSGVRKFRTYVTMPKNVQIKEFGVRQVLLNGEEGASPGRVVEVPAGADGEERVVAAPGSGLQSVCGG